MNRKSCLTAVLLTFFLLVFAGPGRMESFAQAADTGTEDRVGVLINAWGMPYGFSWDYAWNSALDTRGGDLTEYPGQECKFGHVNDFPYSSHMNIMPFCLLYEVEGYEYLYDNCGIYKLEDGIYKSVHPDGEDVMPEDIGEDIAIVPMVEVTNSRGEYYTAPDPRDGTDYVEGYYKIGDTTNLFSNGLSDVNEISIVTYMRYYGVMGGPLEGDERLEQDPAVQEQEAALVEMLEGDFGDSIDIRFGYYTAVPGYSKRQTEVAREFAQEGFTKLALIRETTDNNRFANEFLVLNYVKEPLCEEGTLDDTEIYQSRQVGRTPEFNTMNLRNIKDTIERYPEGSTIAILYVTRGLIWGRAERTGPTGFAHPWSKEIYHENAYLNYLSYKKALKRAYGDRYNLVFTKGGVESDVRLDNFYSYNMESAQNLVGYPADNIGYYTTREAIQMAKEDGHDKIIAIPAHWHYDNLDTVFRGKELNGLPLTPKQDIAAGMYDNTHCEDIDGNVVDCQDDGAAAEITVLSAYSDLNTEFATSYYAVIRGPLERFGLYPQDEWVWKVTSKEITKLAGGTVEADSMFSFINGTKIEIPGDPYPDRPQVFTDQTGLALNDPADSFDCMWEDTEIILAHRLNPPAMKSARAVGPAVHLGPYRTFFNRDVTVTIPYWWFMAMGQEVSAYIYNHITDDWDPVEVESAENGLVTFKTKVLGLFRVGTK